MTGTNAIAVFARAPEPGKVKTRLARHLGDETAKRLYVAMLRDTLQHAQAAANTIGDCKVMLAFTPDDAFGAHLYSLADYWSGARLFQDHGDLGNKIHRVFASLFADGAGRVIVIGSDMPTLSAPALGLAFTLLADDDLIFGPAHDGGFYLIGANATFDKQLFADVQWSSAVTLQQVLSNTVTLNLGVDLLPPGRDVDTIEDVRDLALRLRGNDLSPDDAPHTFEALLRENLL